MDVMILEREGDWLMIFRVKRIANVRRLSALTRMSTCEGKPKLLKTETELAGMAVFEDSKKRAEDFTGNVVH